MEVRANKVSSVYSNTVSLQVLLPEWHDSGLLGAYTWADWDVLEEKMTFDYQILYSES